MAKKKEPKQTTPSAWSIKFKEKADKINDAKRAAGIKKEPHVPKIPRATLFIDGRKIILNA
ncbi:MAG: hypothetical protein IJV92_03405 [Phascolarctobacterium sp.]|nr:hypothetical protein [Phascolarctobacterium sp.]